MSSFLTALQHN